LFLPSGQPNLSDNLHVDSPMMLDMVIDSSDLLDTKLDLDLLPCLPPHKLRKFYDCILNFQLQWVAKLPWVEGVLDATPSPLLDSQKSNYVTKRKVGDLRVRSQHLALSTKRGRGAC